MGMPQVHHWKTNILFSNSAVFCPFFRKKSCTGSFVFCADRKKKAIRAVKNYNYFFHVDGFVHF